MSTGQVTLAFVGDLMLGRRVNEMAAQYSPESVWGDVLPILCGADAVFGNLECPITVARDRWRQGWKAFRFRAHPRVIDILKAGNIRFVSLANNHILDCDSEGLRDTVQYLDAAGIAHAGAGSDLGHAMRPALVDVAGLTVGVISITDTMREFGATASRAGTYYVPIRSDAGTLGQIERTAGELRRAGAGVVVLSAHWGPNLRPRPPARYRRFAREVTELGVDIVHGHSAHLLQGIEICQNRVILYDTGDFLDDYWIFPMVRTDRSCLFLVDIADGRIRGLRLVPVLLERGRVRRAVGKEARAITTRMLRASTSAPDADPVMTAEVHFLDPVAERARAFAQIDRGLDQAKEPLPMLATSRS